MKFSEMIDMMTKPKRGDGWSVVGFRARKTSASSQTIKPLWGWRRP